MADFQIRDLERVHRNPWPYWKARVVVGVESLDVDSRNGSWQCDSPTGRREVVKAVATALQARVRPLEKKERREAA